MNIKMLNEKAVLISINPQWCELIAVGKKLREIRKNFPKLQTPFIVYIYCTNGMSLFGNSKIALTDKLNILKDSKGDFERTSELHRWNGKVIGEFVCDGADIIEKRGINHNFDYCYLDKNTWGNDDIEIEINAIKMSCVEQDDLNTYGAKADKLYAWHITNLVIYDVPKELSEFRCECNGICFNSKKKVKCKKFVNNGFDCDRLKSIVRPPQNYCFVERLVVAFKTNMPNVTEKITRALLEEAWAESYDFPTLPTASEKRFALTKMSSKKIAIEVYEAAMSLREDGVNWYGGDFEKALLEVIEEGDKALKNPDIHITLTKYREIINMREKAKEKENDV